jgi:hypothetical protein
MNDKNRFATAWQYANEYIKEDYEKASMMKHVVNSFLSSPLVTEMNKSNLMGLVQKLSDRDLKAE